MHCVNICHAFQLNLTVYIFQRRLHATEYSSLSRKKAEGTLWFLVVIFICWFQM